MHQHKKTNNNKTRTNRQPKNNNFIKVRPKQRFTLQLSQMTHLLVTPPQKKKRTEKKKTQQQHTVNIAKSALPLETAHRIVGGSYDRIAVKRLK